MLVGATLNTCHTVGNRTLDLSLTPPQFPTVDAVLTQCPICTESVDLPWGLSPYALAPLVLPAVPGAISGTFVLAQHGSRTCDYWVMELALCQLS